MEIIVKEQSKVVEFWLTKAEKADTEFRQSLLPVFKDYKERGYLPVVFLSGNKDLFEETKELLLHNKRVLAKKSFDHSR